MSLAGSWRLCRRQRARLGHPVKVVRLGEFEMTSQAAQADYAHTYPFNCVAFF